MGVRAGQGFGSRKPKRRLCPQCGKRGMTQWRATAYGMLRWCQYCQHSEGQGVYEASRHRAAPGA
jgi:DnaJ-class molecular chaperone